MTKSLHNQGTMLSQLVNSRNDSQELKKRMNDLINGQQGLGSILIAYIVNGVNASSSGQLSQVLGDRLLNAVYDRGMPPINEDSVFNIPNNRRATLEKRFISKLRYDGMYDRELRVAEAHQETFHWIFETGEQEQPWANFREWLESDQLLYWITGKAGSGKSTLMKFISQPVAHSPSDHLHAEEPRCTGHLRRWADGQPLIIATFYFWEAGSEMQKSKDGLYRSLLCQILQACPEAISHASPERWEALCLYNNDPRPFTEVQLRDILAKTITFVGSTRKLCIFIDGLDEFSGNHDDLIKLVKGTTEASLVKICVASRPWMVFEDSLKGKPSLMLEDLTSNDIKKYVTSMVSDDPEFALLQKREPVFAQNLVSNIVRKASGVFLWVTLVVASLMNGMSHGDRVSDLQRRLDQLPSDLGTLYDKIIDDIDEFYLQHAAQFFYSMLACPQPPEALLLSFADEEDPDFAINLPNQPLSSEDIGIRVETMRRRLNSCCKGLIAIPKSALRGDNSSIEKVTVQYLHKSVKDYIERPRVLEKLSSMIGEAFDPYFNLCSGALAMWKTHRHEDYASEGHEKLHKCMRFASMVPVKHASLMAKVLDELERSISRDYPDFDFSPILQRLAGRSKSTIHDYFGNCILSLAVKYHIVEYVKRKAEPGCLVQSGPLNTSVPHPIALRPKWPSWNVFTRLARGSHGTGSANPHAQWPLLLDATPSLSTNLEMVTALLENGADPNFIINRGSKTNSVWIETLACAIANIETSSGLWDELLPLMVVHGARLDASVFERAIELKSVVYGDSEEGITITAYSLRQALKSVKSGKPGSRFRLADAKRTKHTTHVNGRVRTYYA